MSYQEHHPRSTYDPQNEDNDAGVVTRQNLKTFKAKYESAITAGLSEFNFEGPLVSVAHAKYVLQYMGENK